MVVASYNSKIPKSPKVHVVNLMHSRFPSRFPERKERKKWKEKQRPSTEAIYLKVTLNADAPCPGPCHLMYQKSQICTIHPAKRIRGHSDEPQNRKQIIHTIAKSLSYFHVNTQVLRPKLRLPCRPDQQPSPTRCHVPLDPLRRPWRSLPPSP